MSNSDIPLIGCLKNPLCFAIGAFLLYKYVSKIDRELALELKEDAMKLASKAVRKETEGS
jgi:hypothetical protein